ncbi:MAG: hypothetical protein ACREPT_10245, partial [Rudaea sp.]
LGLLERSHNLAVGESGLFHGTSSEQGYEKIPLLGSANLWGDYRSKNLGHQRAGRRLTDLFLDVLSWNVVDFSQTMLGDVVMTDHALEVLQGNGLTGFTVKPTRVSSFPAGVKGSEIPKLWEFIPTGTAGAAHKDSGIVELYKCDGCGLVQYSSFKNGIVVDQKTYDGSDFFTVIEYPKYILVSQRAKLVMEKNRLSNAGFIQSTKLQWPKGVAEPI